MFRCRADLMVHERAAERRPVPLQSLYRRLDRCLVRLGKGVPPSLELVGVLDVPHPRLNRKYNPQVMLGQPQRAERRCGAAAFQGSRIRRMLDCAWFSGSPLDDPNDL
jgi:hypothetical protein